MRDIPGEAPWGPGATGTATWRGVALADVLAGRDPARGPRARLEPQGLRQQLLGSRATVGSVSPLADDDPLLGKPGGDYNQRKPLDERDFSRRTLLANERTYLAWWRTGLTTLTVALAAARVVPGLSDVSHRWPYTAVGVLFSVLGVVCIAYGEQRRRAVDRAVRQGSFADASPALTLTLTALGCLAGAALVALILLDG